MRLLSSFASFGVIASLLSLLAGCGDQTKGAAPPPTEVGIITVAPERLTVTNELPGRVEANRIAQVRARVAGIVQKRLFTEGSDVKEGQVLFRIDPRSYQASYESSDAALKRAEANFVQADLKLQRYKKLVEINAVSKQEFDDATAAQKQAAADVAAAKSARTNAGLNLEYATVTAPISGRIGRALVTEGALVGQGDATPLATIQQIDPIYVNLTQSSAELMQLRQAMQNGQLRDVSKGELKVKLVTEDGNVYPLSGKLLFSDISVDETTGAVTLRALFPNPKHMLMPGMFVRAQLQQAVNEQAIAVPQQAVQRSADGATVMVVGEGDKVEVRKVTTTSSSGNRWIIGEGLKPGDRVIVEGLQKIRPGAPVRPVPWQPAATPDAKDSPKPQAETKPGADKSAPAAAQPAQKSKAE
jgi:membrane fusion protein (multidrug efflux system)